MPNQTYLVEWRMHIEATSPQEAAEKAREYQTRPGTTANVFHVTNENGEEEVVDLQETIEQENQLFDWQSKDSDIADPTPTTYSLSTESDRIDIDFGEKQIIWIEKQDGRIRVHCYHDGIDTPVTVEIHEDRIEVDAEDYLEEVLNA